MSGSTVPGIRAEGNGRRRVRAVATAAVIVAMAAAAVATAQAPELVVGECTWLVGAPPGEPAAPTEETGEGSLIFEECPGEARVETNRDRPNSVHVWLTGRADDRSCRVRGWVEHRFTTPPGSAPLRAAVSMTGALAGEFGFTAPSGRLDALMQLVESWSDTDNVLAEAPIFVDVKEFRKSRVTYEFGRGMASYLLPGRAYALRLLVELKVDRVAPLADFGSPGSGHGVHYDRIEVCLNASDASADLEPRFDALDEAVAEANDGIAGLAPRLDDLQAGVAAANAGIADLLSRLDRERRSDIEDRLHRKACVPSLWLPEAHGGRLEEARALVAELLAAAEASGAPGVNSRVAGARLAAADAATDAGDFQRACRNLSDAVRMLTTP